VPTPPRPSSACAPASSSIDTCLYTFERQSDGAILWVLIYVDDALLCHSADDLRADFVGALSRRFPTEDKGSLSWILNLSVTRDRSSRTLTISQELYVTDLMSKFGHLVEEELSRRYDCPMEEGFMIDTTECPVLGSAEHDAMRARREIFMSLVGAFLWLANMTMPHLSFAASQLARVLTNPGESHFKAALRVLLFLRSVPYKPLVYAANSDRGLDTYVDSSWAVRFSCSGCMVFYHGCLFHWFSKMQKSVSLSSAEAEYFGAMLAARDLIFLRELLLDLGVDLSGPSVMYCDSKSAVGMSFDPVSFKKTKHILRAAEFLRDLVVKQIVTLVHLKGTVMVADLLTKAVSRAVYSSLILLLLHYSRDGVVSPNDSVTETEARSGGARSGSQE
jgi:hypothetical protein